MKRAITLLLSLALILIAVPSASAADRFSIAPQGTGVLAPAPGRVVASDNGLFLIHGQRITPDGVNLDGEPLPAAVGEAVAWHDGWMLVNWHESQLYIRHLGSSGDPELRFRIPALGIFAGAASVGGRLAILEQVSAPYPGEIWITTLDETRVLHRRRLGALSGASIARFGDGFLVVSWVRTTPDGFPVGLWRIDSDGRPLQYKVIGTSKYELGFGGISIAASGDRALVATWSSLESRTWVVNPQLAVTPPVGFPASGQGVVRGVVATYGSEFVVLYTQTHQPTQGRIRIIGRDGNVRSDEASYPVAEIAQTGDRYAVVRWWGDVAIASPHPATIVTTVPVEKRTYDRPSVLDTVVSGDVTLVMYGQWDLQCYVRVDSNGVVIDDVPRDLPKNYPNTRIVPIPEGFAVLWSEGRDIGTRRLSRRGDWIDAEWKPILTRDKWERFEAHGGDSDILVAFSTTSEVVWGRFAFDGTPLQASPARLSHVGPHGGPPETVAIAEKDGNRLLLIRDQYYCTLSPCDIPRLLLETLVLDTDGAPRSPLAFFESWPDALWCTSLPDGRWIVPVPDGDAILLGEDGSFIERRPLGPLVRYLEDVAPTPNGWKAIVGAPSRIIEFNGAFDPVSVTGLFEMESARFGRETEIAFLHPSPERESIIVPWISKASPFPGDLSIRLTDRGAALHGRYVTITVRNEGETVSPEAYVVSGESNPFFAGEPFAIDALQPGEELRIESFVQMDYPHLQLVVLSEDIADVAPENNEVRMDEMEPGTGRRRPSRP